MGSPQHKQTKCYTLRVKMALKWLAFEGRVLSIINTKNNAFNLQPVLYLIDQIPFYLL